MAEVMTYHDLHDSRRRCSERSLLSPSEDRVAEGGRTKRKLLSFDEHQGAALKKIIIL